MIRLAPGPVEVGGVHLANHLLLAAGVLGTTGASLARILNTGAGGVVTKSLGPRPFPGHPGPCIAAFDGYMLNAMGLPNPSRGFRDEWGPLRGQPVIVSIFGGTPEEFRTVAGWFIDLAAGFELNLSCPHAEGFGSALGSDPSIVEDCTRVVADLGLPTWVKLTPNVTDIVEIGIAAQDGGATALVAINTLKGMRISTELCRPVLGNRFGGVSGSAIFPVSIRCVYELFDACSIPIIGCGGIRTASDVLEMIMAGASAVQIGSAVMEDEHIFQGIAAELYSPTGINAEEILGCAHD
ncbi:MAG: dihydroorotate dehydrogenase [Methanomicrobiales archaeon]|nr:dihydroorotate dehydrogenase [Methanomicrobiales archaeon]